jgi:hypothetical protein
MIGELVIEQVEQREGSGPLELFSEAIGLSGGTCVDLIDERSEGGVAFGVVAGGGGCLDGAVEVALSEEIASLLSVALGDGGVCGGDAFLCLFGIRLEGEGGLVFSERVFELALFSELVTALEVITVGASGEETEAEQTYAEEVFEGHAGHASWVSFLCFSVYMRAYPTQVQRFIAERGEARQRPFINIFYIYLLVDK